jgi:hypothetical protein
MNGNTIKMANDSVIDHAFNEAFNELGKYYDDDELDTCVEKARELLQNSALSRYHRIRTLVLLGSTAEYGYSSPFLDKCLPFHRDWRVRLLYPADENEKSDAAMDKLRDYILELRAILDQEQADAGRGEDVDTDADDETAVKARLENYEAQSAEDKALAEAENDDPEALLAQIPKP